AGFTDVNVVNVAIANLDDSYDLVVTHQDLTLRARDRTPSAQHVSVSNFMASPRYDEIVEEVKHTNAPQDSSAPRYTTAFLKWTTGKGLMVIELEDIAYVRSGVTDLPAAVRFATDIVGLELVTSDERGVAPLLADN